ncbi:MAG TPA: DNA recombination protein RmuC [Thermoanaerobaculales bacterium]|nr:DNA recombination protein RmuC [Thermoanaerobaculales bacterium]HPA81300.1 DNA recombination protein RmuC [Thermoanaerobaculales bacterium]HQN97231.1 DNA recombination protein RmuC [Thermoanaerobaculales bacterium]HQP43677.1 DNA recombination protein RmuC [Thermoanaerobaculales bacterium]
MELGSWLPLFGVAGLVVAAVALVAVVLLGRASRAAAERGAARMAADQAETLRWVSGQLTQSLDRFHTQLGEFGQRLADAQASSSEVVRRGVAEHLQALGTTVSTQLERSHKTLGENLAGATEVFGQLHRRLGEVAEIAVRLEQVAGSVDELGKILRVPKLRGLMGEQTLEVMLRQVLPERFWQMQYRFEDGRTVDAVVRLGDRLIPIDAKFPLESYQRIVAADSEEARRTGRRDFERSVKTRVDEIAGRYIRPGEGTVEFALMFVPAEGVFGEVVGGGDDPAAASLLDYALERRVMPVSPATIFAYLSVIASGLRGFAVERRAGEIVQGLAAAEQEVARLREELGVLGKHLVNATQRYGEVERRLARVEEKLGRVAHVGEEALSE